MNLKTLSDLAKVAGKLKLGAGTGIRATAATASRV